MSRRRAGALTTFVALAGIGLLAGCSEPQEVAGGEPVDRVLLVTMPGVSWDDVDAGHLPTLDALADGAAVGHLSTRVGRQPTDDISAYLTISAGTRAVAPARATPVETEEGEDIDPSVAIDASVAVEAHEVYLGLPAGDILQRRLGHVPDGVVYLAAGAAREANEASPYGAATGTLGEGLADVGVRRAVVANADQGGGGPQDPAVDRPYDRVAAAALMDSQGIVPEGRVARGLLVDDPTAPFGQRLDPAVVLDAFDASWERRGGDDQAVVLVEASDLTRVSAYRERATAAQADAMWTAALADADRLLGELLEQVDPEHDTVMVLSPVAPRRGPALGVAVVDGPGIDGGYLRSATTRRDGYVQLADVAPTILDLVGGEVTDDIEGRAFQVNPTGPTGAGSGRARAATLTDESAVAAFRDRMVAPVVLVLSFVLLVVGLAAIFRRRLPPRLVSVLPFVALAALGVVSATFLVGWAGASARSLPAYLAVVVAVTAGLVALAIAVERRAKGGGLLVAVGAVIVVIAGGLLVGAPLQLNTIFGYSVAVAGRFAGLGNLAFALLGSATILLASLLADRFGANGRRAAVAVLVVVVIIEGFPALGGDVGGVLAMVPAFGVTALILLDRRVRWRELLALGGLAMITVLGFALIDLARPAGARTHLARLAEHVLSGRWPSFFDSLARRGQASFGGAEGAAYAAVGLAVVAVAVYLALVAARRVGPDAPRHNVPRPMAAAAAGLALLAVLGLVTNDSSFAVPATMLLVVIPVAVLRTVPLEFER
jgi:hypothetical protein